MTTNSQNVIIQQRRKWVVFEFELPEKLWEVYSRANIEAIPGEIVVGIGLGERQHQVNLHLDDDPHTLIAGATKVAGKSTAVKSMLYGLMENLGPNDLKIFLVDPRRDCEDLYRSPHLMVPPAKTPEETAQVIDCVLAIFKRREARNLRDEFPVFLSVDEAQTIVGEAGRVDELALLGREGAKFKISLIIATQKPLEKHLPGLVYNLGNRLVGRVPQARDSTLLTGNDQALCNKLTKGGDFKLVCGPRLTRLQVAQVTTADLAKLDVVERPDNWKWEPGLFIDNIDKLIEPSPVKATKKKVGRPRVELEADLVARYMAADWQGQPITGPQAEKYFGVHRTGHTLNKKFAKDITAGLRRYIR
jgi:DNA segregation ATPase FtsK/SpoIIIE-like protein